jgi:hypothetical protein
MWVVYQLRGGDWEAFKLRTTTETKIRGSVSSFILCDLIWVVHQLRNEDGKLIDQTYTRDKPFTFKVGSGQVVKGWDEVVRQVRSVP